MAEQRMDRWMDGCGGEEVVLAGVRLKQLLARVRVCMCESVCVFSFCLIYTV